MTQVAALLKLELANYPGVSEISDTFEGGKEEIQLSITAAGRQLGITLADIATQVRTAYLGTEVQSIQRNRDEVKVIVRYPKEERASLAQLERLTIRLPSGESVPLASVANFDVGRGYSQIRRVDRRRTVNVQAEVNKTTANIEGIKTALNDLAETLELEYPLM